MYQSLPSSEVSIAYMMVYEYGMVDVRNVEEYTAQWVLQTRAVNR